CSNTLSLLQRKVTNALLYHAYPELMLKEEHEITVKQLCKLIGYQGNNHAVIKDALKELLSTVIEWNLISDKTGLEDWTASSILASVSLQGPLCYYAYSPRMKQLLHSPSMFGRIDLFIQSQFRSSYGLALYENCIRYRGLPFTKWIEMATFRKLMGVPAGKYVIFRDFKKRVLDKSIEEVNTYSDLVVEAELQREGRRVNKLRFSLKERPKRTRIGGNKAEQLLLTDAQAELRARLMESYQFSNRQAQQVLKEYSQEMILQKMELIERSKNYKTGRIENLAAYLMSALRLNYQDAQPAPKTKPRLRGKNKKLPASPPLNELIEQIREDYQIFRIQRIDETLENLAETDKALFMERFHQYAQIAINTVLHLQRKKYTPETVFSSPQIKAILRQYIEQELLAKEALSLENYIETLPKEKRVAWKQNEKQLSAT
ncbi:MAG TPA: replication initiation protein, partial [Gammaproteobacteria bacterium]|nr:replication initiation protein [Gammaproteobacteria bacterium]